MITVRATAWITGKQHVVRARLKGIRRFDMCLAKAD
jgi:hypothetical protein